MKLENFYHLEYSVYYLRLYGYIYIISVDVSFGFLQVFLVEFGSLYDKFKKFTAGHLA